MALSSSTRLASIGLVAIGALSVEARAQALPTTPPAAQTQQQQPPAAPAVTAPQVTLPAVAQPQIAQPQAAQPAAVQPQLAPPAVTPAARPNARRAASPSLAQRRAQALAATQAAQARAAQPPAAGQTAPAATQAAPVTTSASVDTMIARLAPQMDLRVGEGAGGLRLSGTVGVVVMMGLLTLLPTLVLMMTGFTRILIVLHFLKQALGTQSAPPAHLVGGLALLLTGFVMGPTLGEVNRTALQPWMNGQIEQAEMMSVGVRPFREFMLKQTRERDIEVFIEMSRMEAPATVDDVPLVVLVSAFVTSELRTAFQIGFALFLPFIIIDIVVSSVLMSMGMMMLPPAMIALPFKLLLFVLVDGWTLVIQSLVQSFK
jgi:flagellar biosynthetic protein FliP